MSSGRTGGPAEPPSPSSTVTTASSSVPSSSAFTATTTTATSSSTSSPSSIPSAPSQYSDALPPVPRWDVYLTRLLRQAARNFVAAYGLKAALNLVFALLSPKSRGNLLRSLRPWFVDILGMDALRFGAFASVMSTSYVAVRTLLARYLSIPLHSVWSPLLGGTAAGLAIALDASEERRHELALYVLARAGHASWLLGEHSGVLPSIPHGGTLVFSSLCAVIMYAFLFRPDALKRSYAEFIGRLASQARFSNVLWVLREIHGVPHNPRHYYKSIAAFQPEFVGDPRLLKRVFWR